MIGIDTNILLRLWLNDDPAQNGRIDALLAAHGGTPRSLLVTDVVLAEAVWPLKSAFDQDKPAQLLAVRSLRWLARVRRGAYVPVPIESPSADVALEDPWSVAMTTFAPCYMGGRSAAEHWGLTEQIFRSVCVGRRHSPCGRDAGHPAA
ncbi:MAG: hypothetical protein JNN18_10465 [Rubrivivax sp.]|nr:hypothetical protein [Rubrivivax sp.]